MPPQNPISNTLRNNEPPEIFGNVKKVTLTGLLLALQIIISLAFFYAGWAILFLGFAIQFGAEYSIIPLFLYTNMAFYPLTAVFICLTLFNIFYSIRRIIKERKETHILNIFLLSISLFVTVLAILE